jgi:FkbM family methyltransferase
LFSDRLTWLGTTNVRVDVTLVQDFQLSRSLVEQNTIDRFIPQYRFHPDLIKIDTECNELRILRGSRETSPIYTTVGDF